MLETVTVLETVIGYTLLGVCFTLIFLILSKYGKSQTLFLLFVLLATLSWISAGYAIAVYRANPQNLLIEENVPTPTSSHP